MRTNQGTLAELTVHSRALIRPMQQHIYLPPGYGSHRAPYPVVYLLHPWGQDNHFWTDALALHDIADRLINAGALPPFIGVMPQGDKSFFINAADPGGDFSLVLKLDPEHFAGAMEGYGDYGDYILKDVIPCVERKYPVRTDRAGRVISGLGMGASGAAVLAFSHPGYFGAVGIHSPTLYSSERLGPPWIFGLGDPQAFAKRDPVQLARALPPTTDLQIYLDSGQSDEAAGSTETLHEAMARRGISHIYVSRPGANDEDYWHVHLAEYLGFYAAGW